MAGLRISSLSWRYGEKVALDAVSLSVEPGQFCALLGPNGAGKSTLFNLATGLFGTAAGAVSIGDADLATDSSRALGQLGVVFQQQTLDLDLSVRENLRYFGSLQGMSRPMIEARSLEALGLMDMEARVAEIVRSLNGGHRRRTEIARAMLHRPKVLLLDEPTVGLDPAARDATVALVHDLCDKEGVAVLWATHLVDEVRPGDRVVVLHQGRIRADGPVDAVVARTGKTTLDAAFRHLTEPAAAA